MTGALLLAEAAKDAPLSLEFNLLLLLSVPALILLNAFFVAAEFALVAVRKTQVEEEVRKGSRSARILHNQITHLDHAIAATQLGITIASIGLGWVGERALAGLLDPLLHGPMAEWSGVAAHTMASAIAFVFITFFHVALGELAPKAIALQRPVQTSLWLAIPLELFTRVTRPFVILMNGIGNGFLRLVGFHALDGEKMVHSVEELRMLVGEVEEAGLLSPEQADYVINVFRLTQKKVSECMVPREKLAALELMTPPEQVLEAVRSGAHTRIPVYEGELDNVVGIVNTKDLFYLFSVRGVVLLQDAMYPPLFLKPEQPIDDALLLFRRSRKHMAVVRTAEGKVVGLITLEDILEEIVGDIEDEHDRPQRKVRLNSR
jgi:CBS domain containing-hemolysin-like protein